MVVFFSFLTWSGGGSLVIHDYILCKSHRLRFLLQNVCLPETTLATKAQ